MVTALPVGNSMRHFFEYVPQFKLWLVTNDPPEFSSGDHSIARRIRVIEFPVAFDEAAQDQQLFTRLIDEASGILNCGSEGYAEWNSKGLTRPIAFRSQPGIGGVGVSVPSSAGRGTLG